MSHDFGVLPTVESDEDATRTFLAEHQWPIGFTNLILEETKNIPVRFFICDDSGSMCVSDGQHIVSKNGINKSLQCSRWQELTESLHFHLELAQKANCPSEFRFLNCLSPKFIGNKELDPDNSAYRAVKKVIDQGSPSGGTPLCRHINDVVHYIRQHEKALRDANQFVSLIICTDGVPSDGDITQAMRPLTHLPCMIVIRLCTNQDSIVEFWDNVEKDLETNLDLIDDIFGESDGVVACNPWINYGVPLQRLREFGVKVKELDMIDEKLLTTQQMVKVLSILFDTPVKNVPDPLFDWPQFESWVVQMNNKIPFTFNPSTKKNDPEPWIIIGKLRQCYGPPGGCCTIA